METVYLVTYKHKHGRTHVIQCDDLPRLIEELKNLEGNWGNSLSDDIEAVNVTTITI